MAFAGRISSFADEDGRGFFAATMSKDEDETVADYNASRFQDGIAPTFEIESLLRIIFLCEYAIDDVCLKEAA